MFMVIGLIVAFVIVAFYARKNRGMRQCRWRADRSGDRGSLRMYRCAFCGAEAFTATSGPPQNCKKSVGKGGL
ncbi:hypothetical protein [Sulfitobacter sp. S190]|uniref:hypothetical protein n=1 Tax=Sulfitobacter sp. S190 TaxID=2867022 RepID=UPI0021A2E76D|nr:hypothetical protein [Sulfitobacter sp. S190]UWR21678.1 hypothetical protein K3756_13420 [Sulfitobacter sp. S190]